jgi:hypothetical protein
MFDKKDELFYWVKAENDQRGQMARQAEAALDVGRLVIWHAQTEKGFRGLSELANKLRKKNLAVKATLSVVYDPN